jgi:hypothetical protein
MPALEFLAEIARLRQALWDVYRICGGDTDGDLTPAAIQGDMVPMVLECAQSMADEYWDLLRGEHE